MEKSKFLYFGFIIELKKQRFKKEDGFVLFPTDIHFKMLCNPYYNQTRHFFVISQKDKDKVEGSDKIILGIKPALVKKLKLKGFYSTVYPEDFDLAIINRADFTDINKIHKYLDQELSELLSNFKSHHLQYGVFSVSHTENLV